MTLFLVPEPIVSYRSVCLDNAIAGSRHRYRPNRTGQYRIFGGEFRAMTYDFSFNFSPESFIRLILSCFEERLPFLILV